MSGQIRCPGQGVRRLLWRGVRGESIGTCLGLTSEENQEAVIQDKEYVARPMPVIEVEQKLMNMRAYIGGVIQMTDGNGDVIENVVVYANLLNNMQCNEDWIIIGEKNKDDIFHVHTLARTGVRTDAYRRTQQSIWKGIQSHPAMIHEYGNSTCDMMKCQKAHKPCALLEYMCKAPIWICSNSDKLLQLTYDIATWDLGARFRTASEEKTPDIDKANPMVQEILQCIMEHNCKTLEDVIRKGPEIVVKHLHKAGFSSIVQNCLTYSKCVGHTWSLKQYASVVSDPSYIHSILLHQGLSPSDFDYVFWQWITKRHAKRNTIHIFGASNTGKSSFLAGLGKVCPGGEIVNGNNFNFEGLIDCYWGKWEEPLCSPEIAEKCKQIFEGMECAIPVKFKKPYMLPRTPIAITTNAPIWHWCENQKGPFMNRMWMYTFKHDMTNGRFIPRFIEPSCKCRSCTFSRGGTPSASCSTTEGLSGTEQPIQEQLVTRTTSKQSTMGSRSMSGTTGSSRQSDSAISSSGESSSDTTSRGSSSSTIDRSDRSSREHRSSDSSERICSTRRGSSEQMGTDPSRISSGSDSDGMGGSESSRTNVTGRVTGRHEVLSSMVSMGGARAKKRKVEFQIQTNQREMGRKLETLIVPGKNEWAAYLSFIYHRYEQAVSKPDLFAYEELDEDSE
uniref:Nonstructural protein n=1 Tax=Cygnus atratus Chaphamaparvovirus TaxID=2794485 RepID=A0A8A4XDG2_9VIRU|nr:MAG: nonstructural protein [Cygnus atratus Chaphamaparvovirus]